MKTDPMIEHWAHMLDEAFDKEALDGKKEKVLPKDQNEKFKFNEVFPPIDAMNAEEIEHIFDAIWPKWLDYFNDEVDKTEEIDITGAQRDVDDFDEWKIKIEDVYGNVDGMVDNMFKNLEETHMYDNETMTLKELIDSELERMAESAPEYCDPDTLKDHGRCVYRGKLHWGGRYPG